MTFEVSDYMSFQDDLKAGYSIEEALSKHNLSLNEAFNTLQYKSLKKSENKKNKNPVTVEPHIFKRGNTYGVRKTINKKFKLFGFYRTLRDARRVKSYCEKHDWRIEDIDRMCDILCISRMKRGDYKKSDY